MWINAVGLVVNVIFDYLFIFGRLRFPGHGHCRSRYATVLANWASALFGAYLLFKNKHEVSYRVRSAWRWNKDLVRRYIRYGLPSGLQWALEGLALQCF